MRGTRGFTTHERRLDEGHPRPARSRLPRAWWAYLALGTAVILGYFLLPSAARDYLYDLVALSAVVAIVFGIRMHRPERPLP